MYTRHLRVVVESWRFSLEPEDFTPEGKDVVPLWEGENSITGFFLDEKGEHVFIKYDVEYIDKYTRLGNDIKDVLRDLIQEYVEEDEMNSVVASLDLTSADFR